MPHAGCNTRVVGTLAQLHYLLVSVRNPWSANLFLIDCVRFQRPMPFQRMFSGDSPLESKLSFKELKQKWRMALGWVMKSVKVTPLLRE